MADQKYCDAVVEIKRRLQKIIDAIQARLGRSLDGDRRPVFRKALADLLDAQAHLDSLDQKDDETIQADSRTVSQTISAVADDLNGLPRTDDPNGIPETVVGDLAEIAADVQKIANEYQERVLLDKANEHVRPEDRPVAKPRRI